ncbi:response regulator transcription factor [Ignavibacterium sp.]|uniref:response regulator transcription factor n=1 Tax=Ignavibacterium sp. TaxID=2651167 RepID=UPI00307EA2BD
MTRILLIDDEQDILEFLKYNLELEGYQVITGTDGFQALEKVAENPDLIVLDIMMPKLDGFEVIERLRADKRYKDIPVIFLTAKAGEINEIKGLELGASDYLQKPISPKKLIARVKANLKKTDSSAAKQKLPDNLTFGPIEIDRKSFTVLVDGEQIYFPRKEFEILFFLLANPGRVFSREILLKEVWGNDIYVVDRTVDVHVRKIREKLGKYSELIETIKGVGYKVKSVE